MKRLGNFLMLASFSGLLLIYWPFLKLFLFPTKIGKSQMNKGIFIEIPKINAVAPIIKDVNPWDEKEYKNALLKGVAHAKGSALPGEGGSVYLFAHSSDLPWRITRYNTIFFLLGRLNLGDEIVLFDGNRKFIYRVSEKKIVWPNEVSYLTAKNSHGLILQTCTPIGTSLKRLLVFADPV